MVKVIRQEVYYMEGRLVKGSQAFMTSDKRQKAAENTITHRLLSSRRAGGKLCADVFAAEEEDYTGIVRAADKLGVKAFPKTTVLFGEPFGDHDFSLSAAKKFGAEFVPSHACASEAYLRESVVCTGDIVLGTNVYACGALGALSVTCGGGTLLKALRSGTFQEEPHPLVAVLFRGKLKKGVGPTDVALAIEQALVRAGDFGRDKILECFGASNLSMDFRVGIDTYLSELCYATLWETDACTQEYFSVHGREEGYKPLSPVQPAYYDGGVTVDLGKVEPMISLGGDILTVRELTEDPAGRLKAAEAKYEKTYGSAHDFTYACRDGNVYVTNACVDRFTATYETLAEMGEILRGSHLGADAACSVYPASPAVLRALAEGGSLALLIDAGLQPEAPAYASTCGLCVSDGTDGEVILDARTIASTLASGGLLTPATSREYNKRWKKYAFHADCARGSVYHGAGRAEGGEIDYVDEVPMPDMEGLPRHLLLELTSAEALTAEEPVYRGDFTPPEGTEVGRALVTCDTLGWADALALRECGVRAVISASFDLDMREALIDWGVLPLAYGKSGLKEGHFLYLEGVAGSIETEERLVGKILSKGKPRDIALSLGALAPEERELLIKGGLLNVKGGK